MAQAMRVDAPEIGPPCSIRHDRAHASRGEMVMGRDAPYEYGPAQCVHGAGLFQVFDQPETDVLRQGNAFYTVSLAAHYDRARSPFDIVQHELCDLAAS
jgi:hypothetical protein